MARSAKQQLVVDPATSARLGRVRQRDTKPEITVRRALYALGVRYRVNNRDLPGSPDVANRAKKWVVFVHGCFWHRHEGCPRATTPKRNREFWLAKFERNRQRDSVALEELQARGYRTTVVWECQTEQPETLNRALEHLAEERGDQLPSSPGTATEGANRRPPEQRAR